MSPKKDNILTLGQGLDRPECVLTHVSGLIFTSNCSKNGGISIISPDGTSHHLLGNNPHNALKPNGIALEHHGRFLVAHLGESSGGIYRIQPNGATEPVVTHANGNPLPPTNFVTLDSFGRIWITVSTTLTPRDRDYRPDACTGFIAVAEPGQSDAQIVASGLGYTNECIVDTENSVVYVNETFGRRLTRFDLSDNGSLSNASLITSFSKGTYPDGLAQDEMGDLWVTSIVSNRIIKVSPDGVQQNIIEDCDDAFIETAEEAYASETMSKMHLVANGNTRLKNISSLAFGGADLSTAYVGNLMDSQLYCFDAKVRGRSLPHWDVPLGYLEQYL